MSGWLGGLGWSASKLNRMEQAELSLSCLGLSGPVLVGAAPSLVTFRFGLRAELFQHLPSSTPISGHDKGGPWQGHVKGMSRAQAHLESLGSAWPRSMHVSFRAVYLWLVIVDLPHLIGSKCHATITTINLSNAGQPEESDFKPACWLQKKVRKGRDG